MGYHSVLLVADMNDKEAFCLSYNFHNVSRCFYRDDHEKASSQLFHMEILNQVFYIEPSATLGIGVLKNEQ